MISRRHLTGQKTWMKLLNNQGHVSPIFKTLHIRITPMLSTTSSPLISCIEVCRMVYGTSCLHHLFSFTIVLFPTRYLSSTPWQQQQQQQQQQQHRLWKSFLLVVVRMTASPRWAWMNPSHGQQPQWTHSPNHPPRKESSRHPRSTSNQRLLPRITMMMIQTVLHRNSNLALLPANEELYEELDHSLSRHCRFEALPAMLPQLPHPPKT